MFEWIAEIFSGGGIVETVGDTIDRFVETPDDKLKAELAKKELAIKVKQMQMDMELAYMNDKQSARKMYEKDDKAQKLLTLLFTIGYFGITAFMMAFLLNFIEKELSAFVISFISTIFGAFNAIMVQIISFYFGSSKGGEDTGKALSNSFKLAAVKKDKG